MVAVQQDAGFALVVEKGAEVDPADHMPAPLELLLEPFLDFLCRILEVGDLVLDHLDVDVLGYQECVVFHVHLHVAELDVCGYLQVGGHPVLGYPGPGRLVLVALGLFLLVVFFLARH